MICLSHWKVQRNQMGIIRCFSHVAWDAGNGRAGIEVKWSGGSKFALRKAWHVMTFGVKGQDWRAISRCSSFHILWKRLGRHIHRWIRALGTIPDHPQLRSRAKGVRIQSWHFLDGRGSVETQAHHPRHWVLDGQVPGSEEGSCFCFFPFFCVALVWLKAMSLTFLWHWQWRLQDIYKFGMSQPPWLLALHKKYHKLGPALKYVFDCVRSFVCVCACELLHPSQKPSVVTTQGEEWNCRGLGRDTLSLKDVGFDTHLKLLFEYLLPALHQA